MRSTDRTLDGHDGKVRAVAVAELDGRAVVISGGEDGTIRTWDAASGVAHATPLTGHSRAVLAVTTCTVDGRLMIVSGGSDRSIRLWDLATGQARGQLGSLLTGHKNAVFTLAAGYVDGRPLIASGGSDKTVRIWDPTNRRAIGRPLRHDSWVMSSAFAENASRPLLVVATIDATVQIWDVSAGSRSGSFKADNGSSIAVGHLPGRPVVLANERFRMLGGRAVNDVWLRDLTDLTRLEAPLVVGTSVQGMATTAVDGRVVVFGGKGNDVVGFDLASRSPFCSPLTGHTDEVTAVAATLSGGHLVVVSGSADGTVRTWTTRA